MKRSSRSASIGFAMTLVLGMFAVLSLGCGTIDADGFLGLEPCDILNCDGLFFRNLAEDHDDMPGMDDAGAHDDGDDEHLDGVDDHDDDGDDDHMDDMDEHNDDDDDAEEEGHHDATEDDDGSGPGVATGGHS